MLRWVVYISGIIIPRVIWLVQYPATRYSPGIRGYLLYIVVESLKYSYITLFLPKVFAHTRVKRIYRGCMHLPASLCLLQIVRIERNACRLSNWGGYQKYILQTYTNILNHFETSHVNSSVIFRNLLLAHPQISHSNLITKAMLMCQLFQVMPLANVVSIQYEEMFKDRH